MARITVNETGTFPVLVLSTDDIANIDASDLANGNIGTNPDMVADHHIPCFF